VALAGAALGPDPDTPLLGYVVPGALARERPGLVAGLAAASRSAKALLATDDSAWEALHPVMNAASDAEFEALKAGFRAGIPSPGPVHRAAAARMLAVMAAVGGEELMGRATELPEGVFW
jgi:NitT/TauT family transport system substrate-binding protein